MELTGVLEAICDETVSPNPAVDHRKRRVTHQHKLGLAGSEALQGAAVTKDDLSGLDDQGQLASDAVSISLVLLGGHCIWGISNGGCRLVEAVVVGRMRMGVFVRKVFELSVT